jgi:hypothetical protein
MMDKRFGVLVRGEIGCEVEMDGAPIPPLRHDAGPARAHTGTADFWQQNPEFGRNARSRLLLKNAGLDYIFQECSVRNAEWTKPFWRHLRRSLQNQLPSIPRKMNTVVE